MKDKLVESFNIDQREINHGGAFTAGFDNKNDILDDYDEVDPHRHV
jgi:hypothetical protein